MEDTFSGVIPALQFSYDGMIRKPTSGLLGSKGRYMNGVDGELPARRKRRRHACDMNDSSACWSFMLLSALSQKRGLRIYVFASHKHFCFYWLRERTAPRSPPNKKAQYQKSTSDRKRAYLRQDKAAKRWLCIVPDIVRRVAS